MTRRLGPWILVAASVVAMACHRRPESPFDGRGLRMTAHSAITGPNADSILLWIVAVNGSRQTKLVERQHCEVSFAFVGTGPDADRRWTREAWNQSRSDQPVCVTVAILGQLAPGATAETYRIVIPMSIVLGDSLPAGTYRPYLGSDGKRSGGLEANSVVLARR